jgi:hypothetical protein
MRNPERTELPGDRGLELRRTRIPPPALSQPLLSEGSAPAERLQLPALDVTGFYSFLSTMMIVLFIVGLVVVFVYEYEALRRSKS